MAIQVQILFISVSKYWHIVIIRKATGPSSCAKIDEVVNDKLSTSDLRKMYGGNTKKYLESIYNFPTDFDTNIEPSKHFSVSKCGPTKPFDIRGFMNTKSTPLGLLLYFDEMKNVI